MRELLVDSFAGGGGASCGIQLALGRGPDLAINHDAEAIRLHAANHPDTRHYCEDVWRVEPIMACAGRPVGLMWLSPDCKHFSRAKGGKPVSKRVRGLAWVAVRWAAAVRPRMIILENVEEFATWGPLGPDDRPDPTRRGLTFRRFVGRLRALGYAVEWRALRACDYGTPTTRRRLFLVARRDGVPIRWPAPTHGPGTPRPWRTAAECIDWALHCPSIFERRRPLAGNTLRRIAAGLQRFVIDAPAPYLAPPDGFMVHADHEAVAAFLAKHYGDRGQRPGSALHEPIGTVTAIDHHALVTCTLAPRAVPAPRVQAFLVAYYGNERDGQSLGVPMRTVTSRDRLALVIVHGLPYRIADIGMRMLTPRELYRAQGFPDRYVIDHDAAGRPISRTAQVRMAGNSVCPPLAAALVRANEGAAAAEVAA